MRHILSKLGELVKQIDCDTVKVSWNGEFLRLTAHKGNESVQRTHNRTELESIVSTEMISLSFVKYARNAFHPYDREEPK